jgi:TIR domain/CHAT domain
MKKVLILAANPKGTTPLRLNEELRDIAEGLRRAENRDQFSLEQHLAVRSRDIRRALLDYKPQIVHFSGHGAGEEGLVFEDEIGQSKLISSAALAGLFELFAEQIECVVLNGCYSEVQARAIAQHINYVVGMRRAIGDKAAIEFAVGFYDALGAGRSIEFAYKLGCSAIQMAGVEEHLTPVLLPKSEVANNVTQTNSFEQQRLKSESISNLENQAIEIFFSYAHEDENLRHELAKHLKLLERQKVIKAWYDRDITAGNDWKSEIEKQLNSVQIILLLISSDFLASDFCWSVELDRAMQRHEAKEARVIPIILREVDWHSAPFGKLQALPKDGKAVTNWPNRDQAFTDIARGISRVVQELTRNS